MIKEKQFYRERCGVSKERNSSVLQQHEVRTAEKLFLYLGNFIQRFHAIEANITYRTNNLYQVVIFMSQKCPYISSGSLRSSSSTYNSLDCMGCFSFLNSRKNFRLPVFWLCKNRDWNKNIPLKSALLILLFIQLIYSCFPCFHVPTNSLAPFSVNKHTHTPPLIPPLFVSCSLAKLLTNLSHETVLIYSLGLLSRNVSCSDTNRLTG